MCENKDSLLKLLECKRAIRTVFMKHDHLLQVLHQDSVKVPYNNWILFARNVSSTIAAPNNYTEGGMDINVTFCLLS